MATFKKIPLNNTPSRRLTTTFASKIVTIRTYYNQTDNGWFVDFYDINQVPIVLGRALVPGIELLRQFPDLDLGQLAYIVSDDNEGQLFEALGISAQLISRVE